MAHSDAGATLTSSSAAVDTEVAGLAAGSGGRPVLLAIERGTKRYGRISALDDVTLQVHAGEIVAVVGENGAGKSTLVRCVVGDVDLDAGTVRTDARVAVVWQDLALCEDLEVAANVHLGREHGRWLLGESRMRQEADAHLANLGGDGIDVRARVDTLSRGQRQQVALARALAVDADLLLLDEPTASLSLTHRRRVTRLLRQLRDQGRGIVLVAHDLDEVFALADRIVVLRHGRVAAIVTPSEVHPDDVTALMSGIETESMARRQLQRLRSMVEQLSAAAPSASLPLVVSATAVALDQERLCLHLLEEEGDRTVLRRTAAIGLPPALLAVTERLVAEPVGSPIGMAAHVGELVVVEDLLDEVGAPELVAAARATGVRSLWAAPIVGSQGTLGVLTGFGTTTGRLAHDHVELVSLYAGHAAAVIEREQLFDEVSRRNGVLESLRAMLETLAGPERVDGGLSMALLALCRGLGARAVGLLAATGTQHGSASPRWVAIGTDGTGEQQLRALLESHLDTVVAERDPRPSHPAERLRDGIAIATLPLPEGTGAIAASWDDARGPDADALALLDDAARSLALALEREAVEAARRDAAAARRSQALQRGLLQQLSHELRTPLTAIRGYASTMQQPDLTWDAASTDRFLGAISSESARMERLVGDLLDSSAIESGLLRLRRDWTDLALVLEAAVACVPARDRIALHLDNRLEPIWGDHDRLEQVFVNLLENAIRHGGDGTVTVAATPLPDGEAIEVTVTDGGVGVDAGLRERIFEPRTRGGTGSGAGLGLTIARGIAEGHGGTCELLSGTPTTFRVLLPIEPPDAAAADAEETWGTIEDVPIPARTSGEVGP